MLSSVSKTYFFKCFQCFLFINHTVIIFRMVLRVSTAAVLATLPSTRIFVFSPILVSTPTRRRCSKPCSAEHQIA